jgi:large conductance mechanosensitive channel
MVKEFRDFILRGNVVDLAVAVVIGAAFGAVVTSMVEDILTPIVAAIFGEPDFSGLTFEINGSVFRYGEFINAVIAFLTVAAAIFFVVVKPMNALTARTRRPAPDAEPTTRTCPECLSDIPLGARRCPFCTTVLEPSTAA